MPEGDTLRLAEAAVAPVLEGQTLIEVWFRKLRGYRPRVGDRVVRVEATGKYLSIEFARGLILDTHLGMAGTWRAVPNEPGSTPAAISPNPRLRVVLGTSAGRALCFAAPTIETHVVAARSSPVHRLGPDLSNDVVDLDVIVDRSRRSLPGARTADRLLADLLLDQHVAAGVGNVFKSEALFIAGFNPFTSVAALTDDDLRRLWAIAHDLLVANADRPTRRVTTARGTAGATYVYGRHRLGCRVCDNAISFSPAGQRTTRSTYWCPTCQR